MTVATGNFAELLWPGLRVIFGNTYESYPTVYDRVFNIQQSNKSFEKDQGVTTLGLAGIKPQGGNVAFADPIQGFQKEYAHIVYALGSSVTREMWTDDQYNYINSIPEMLAESMIETKETVHASVFNNAFTTELVADGLSLVNASHVNAATGTTQSNQPSTASDLTQTSLEQAHIDIRNWTDDQDKLKSFRSNRLLVPNELMYTAQKILRTSGEVGTDANTINPMMGSLEAVVWDYLTDADAWFVLQDGIRAGLTCFQRWERSIDRDNEFDTMSLKFLSSERYSYGCTDWRAVYGSAGA